MIDGNLVDKIEQHNYMVEIKYYKNETRVVFACAGVSTEYYIFPSTNINNYLYIVGDHKSVEDSNSRSLQSSKSNFIHIDFWYIKC